MKLILDHLRHKARLLHADNARAGVFSEQENSNRAFAARELEDAADEIESGFYEE